MSSVALWTAVRWSVPIYWAMEGPAVGRGFWKARGSDLEGEFPRQAHGNKRAQGRQEEEVSRGIMHGPRLASSRLTWTSAPFTFTLTLTSSARLSPAFKGSNKELLEGPQEQQHRSHLPGLPPRGMSRGGAEGDEKQAGAGTASFLRDSGRLCIGVWHSIPCIRPTD